MVTKNRLLIVDDDRDITATVSRGLTIKGYKVDAFNDPLLAAKCDPTNYDVALLDIRMPRMSGFELARMLWQKSNNLQICFFSAYDIGIDEVRKTLPHLPSHCFIRKPVAPSELAMHIQTHFEKR
ncbi:MAG: response regulator [Nitrososphaera sp.]|jgi:two-component system catabolic regulation response regulator CreB/two-component system response regulator ChvI